MTKILSVRLTEDIRRIIEQFAARGEPKSKIVRTLIARGADAEAIEPILREILESVHSIEAHLKEKGEK